MMYDTKIITEQLFQIFFRLLDQPKIKVQLSFFVILKREQNLTMKKIINLLD